jgi:hypothetical protein
MSDNSDRVGRGGGWWRGPLNARVAYRGGNDPVGRDGGLGFRLVHDVGMVRVRGRLWSELSVPSVTVNYGRDKNLWSSSLGFRLAREGE